MDDVPEEAIHDAERKPAAHEHGPMDDAAYRAHLRAQHGLEVPDHVSRSTIDGLHDRLHDETDATGRSS